MFCAVAILVTALTPSCDVVRDYRALTSPVTKQPLDRYQGGPRRIVAYPVFPPASSRGVVDAPRRPPTPDASDDDDDDDDDDEPVMLPDAPYYGQDDES